MFKQIHKRFIHNRSYDLLEKQLTNLMCENKYLKKDNNSFKRENNKLKKENILLENDNKNLLNQIEKDKIKEIKYCAENTLINYDKCYNNIK